MFIVYAPTQHHNTQRPNTQCPNTPPLQFAIYKCNEQCNMIRKGMVDICHEVITPKMKVMMLGWRIACDIANFDKRAKAMGLEEEFFTMGLLQMSLVPTIPSEFVVDCPETGAQREFTVLEIHPLICGVGPMSADEPVSYSWDSRFDIADAIRDDPRWVHEPVSDSWVQSQYAFKPY